MPQGKAFLPALEDSQFTAISEGVAVKDSQTQCFAHLHS